MLWWELREREEVFAGVVEHVGDRRMGAGEHGDDLVELGPDQLSLAAWDEDRADDRGDHRAGDLGHLREDIAHEVDAADSHCQLCVVSGLTVGARRSRRRLRGEARQR